MVWSSELFHSTVFSLNPDSDGATPFKPRGLFENSDGGGHNSLSTAAIRGADEQAHDRWTGFMFDPKENTTQCKLCDWGLSWNPDRDGSTLIYIRAQM